MHRPINRKDTRFTDTTGPFSFVLRALAAYSRRFVGGALVLNPKLDPNWGNAIVVHSADNYARISDFWALKALAHEYSHAHHLLLAYAGVNPLEYFAELSAMYFVGCNYPPRTRAALERYDPVGAQMVRTMWGLDGAHTPPDTQKGAGR